MRKSICVECSSVNVGGTREESVWVDLENVSIKDLILTLGKKDVLEAVHYWDKVLEEQRFPQFHPWGIGLAPDDTVSLSIT